MKRLWIPSAAILEGDLIHQVHPDGTFTVDVERDGQTTEQHQEGIDYIKSVLEGGAKILPILVLDNEDGTYARLDGFKRLMAQRQLGYKNIEAFIVTQQEYRDAAFFPVGKYQMRAWHGGQDGDDGKLPLLEGNDRKDWKYEDTKFLFKGNDLRIELEECIHVHWGEAGKYRLALGEKDFKELAEAVRSIDG